MKNTLPKICQKLNLNNLEIKSGSECAYISCKNGWGVKLFCKKIQRDHSYKYQKQLSKLNLAPKTGRLFKMRYDKNWSKHFFFRYYAKRQSFIYGYVTQEAKVPKTLTKKIDKSLDVLYKKLSKKGFYFLDAHEGNVGYIKNVRGLVVIDTGPYSFSDEYNYT